MARELLLLLDYMMWIRPQQPKDHATRLAKVAAVSVLAIGFLVLVGWAFDINVFKTVVPGLPRMSASTAICFVLTGTALWVALVSEANARTKQIGFIVTSVVLAMGLSRFIQNIFGWQWGIEAVLESMVGLDASGNFGRMASNTAVGFLLSSVAILWAIKSEHGQRGRELGLGLLGVLTLALAMVVLIAYAAGFTSGHGAPGMALHTATLFLLLGSALVGYAWHESGQAWFLSRRFTAVFVLAGVLMLLVNVAGYRMWNGQSNDNIQLVRHVERLTAASPAANWIKVHNQLSRQTTTEVRHIMFMGLVAGLGLFGGVLWLLNREVAERRNAEQAMRQIEREASQALKESEERFRQMAENIECVFWMSDVELSKFVYVSPACEKVWGRTEASLYAEDHSFLEAVHPDDRERVGAQLRQKDFIQRAGFELEYRIVRPSGIVRWVRDRAFPIKDEQAKVHRFVGITEDVTERKEAEDTARISQERFRSVWESSADGMRLTDKDGRIIAVNTAYCRLAKLPRENLEGQIFSVAYLGHGPNDGIEAYRSRFESGDIVPRLARRVQLWNCEELDVEISNSFLELGYQGRALLSIFRDVSDRRILEDQLRQAQKMEAVGRLAGGVAHDFNNLLVVMHTHAELLLLDGDMRPEGEREGLQQIIKAADRAANLTRQLLAFSRKQVMQSQPLGLNDIIANLTKMLNRIIGEDVHLECRYAGGLQPIQADAGMLEQLIVNLVVNSRDAMPNGGQLQLATEKVVLDATCQRVNPEARPGEFICLTVTDSGSGIAAEHLPRIFEPFFTTKELGKGTGLGLATVYGIVKQHQGWLDVSSRVGAGTTFKVFFPALPMSAQLADKDREASEVCGGSETILLVEDDLSVRMAIKQSLEKYGYTIHEAGCAREALEAWEKYEGEIDLLLTDIVMPEGVNGRQLAEQIRADQPDLGVIFMSGYSADMGGRDTSFFRRNRTAFLQKPFPAPALLAAVRRCVDQKWEALAG